MSSHFDFAPLFLAVYDRALSRFAKGGATPENLLEATDRTWLQTQGITSQHLFDYVEDHHNYGEPGPAQALTIESVRRDYFHQVQGGKPSGKVLDDSRLPGKADTVRGIEWLPRLLPKARAKLRGELPASLMYGCGGDRRFFRTHDIGPAEFLALVWRSGADDQPLIEFVLGRRQRLGLPTS